MRVFDGNGNVGTFATGSFGKAAVDTAQIVTPVSTDPLPVSTSGLDIARLIRKEFLMAVESSFLTGLFYPPSTPEPRCEIEKQLVDWDGRLTNAVPSSSTNFLKLNSRH